MGPGTRVLCVQSVSRITWRQRSEEEVRVGKQSEKVHRHRVKSDSRPSWATGGIAISAGGSEFISSHFLHKLQSEHLECKRQKLWYRIRSAKDIGADKILPQSREKVWK